MKKLFSFFFLLNLLPSAHTQTNLSGQINIYGQFVSQDDCTNTIMMTDAAEFTPGMGIIIIQMNGADINLSNSGNYGNINTFNGAGQYEYNRIVSITGNELTLELSLQNTYSGEGTQVVGFQRYTAATVQETILPANWNGTTGGIIALEVEETLVLNADINAGGAGFRGGQAVFISDNPCNFLTTSNDYAYSFSDWRGAPKGEGIGQATPGEPNGRGAQANGGGGGNDHNSGAGGGALLTAGGKGGVNDEPSFFGCSGNFPGEGGKALPTANNLAFMGGGGGTGHANNSNPSGGGNGGGIIFLKTGQLQFQGGQITTNGLSSLSTTGDGGGGGGAGGSIFLFANAISGTVFISATGGTGGTVSNSNMDRCFGPGGGGSGGALWSNQNLMANLSGGNAGLSVNSISCPEGTNGAESGSLGFSGMLDQWVSGEPFAVPSVQSLSSDTLVCTGELVNLLADVDGDNLQLQWQRLIGGDWLNLVESPQSTGTQTPNLQVIASAMMAGDYRLLVTPGNPCFPEISTAAIMISIIQEAAASPSHTVNGNTVDFMANISTGDFWEWTFMPGQTSTAINPEFEFPGPGQYMVELSVSTACGTLIFPLTVNITDPLIAVIGSSSTTGCAPLTVLFEDQSSGMLTARNWTFSGGNPSGSTDAAPVVTFTEVGTHEVTLSISNGGNTANASSLITVVAPPAPSFEVIVNELTVSLQNTTSNASTYFWNFGDETNSILENPVHTYNDPGVYEISLNASNGYCGVAISQTINVSINTVDSPLFQDLQVYPNPVSEHLVVKNWQKGFLVLYDANGRKVGQWLSPFGNGILDISYLPAGIYLLKAQENEHSKIMRLLKH